MQGTHRSSGGRGERPLGYEFPLPTLLGVPGNQADREDLFSHGKNVPFSRCRQQRRQTDNSRWASLGETYPQNPGNFSGNPGSFPCHVRVKSLGRRRPARSRFSQRSRRVPVPSPGQQRTGFTGIPRSARPKVAGRLSRGRRAARGMRGTREGHGGGMSSPGRSGSAGVRGGHRERGAQRPPAWGGSRGVRG